MSLSPTSRIAPPHGRSESIWHPLETCILSTYDIYLVNLVIHRVDVRLVIKQGKKPFAFVSYSTEAEAKAAVKAFHHSELWGCRLNVELAKSEIRKNEIRNRPWTNHDKGHHNDEDDNYHYEPSIDNDRDQRFLPAGDSDNHQDSDERTVYVFDINFATRRGALRKFGERIGPV